MDTHNAYRYRCPVCGFHRDETERVEMSPCPMCFGTLLLDEGEDDEEDA